MDSAAQRLPRLLALVPYLIARPGILATEAAADFGVTPRELRKDLELLWMCGLPGYGPGDLIDISFEGDTITVTYDAGMRRPLRLTAAEATALLVALRALVDTPDITDADAVRRALGKIESAVGNAQPAGVVVGLTPREPERVAGIRKTVIDALRRGRALHIRYYTASRDTVSERTIDPIQIIMEKGISYLKAWCRSAEDTRLFRLDRIDDVTVLDESSAPPSHMSTVDSPAGIFQPAAKHAEATLVLQANARWIAEYYPMERVEELEDGQVRVRMRYTQQSWMVRLLLGQAGEVHVEQPASLRAELISRAQSALTRNDATSQ